MTTWPTNMYDEGSGGSHHIWHIEKVYFALEAAAPSHVYMTVAVCAFLQYLQLKPCLIIHQAFDDQQMQGQSITIGSWQVLGKFNVMASRAGISLW